MADTEGVSKGDVRGAPIPAEVLSVDQLCLETMRGNSAFSGPSLTRGESIPCTSTALYFLDDGNRRLIKSISMFGLRLHKLSGKFHESL